MIIWADMAAAGHDAVEATFDDAGSATPRSLRLREPVGVIEARDVAGVAGALAEAEAAAAGGLWAAGFVAYEAAPGLNPSLRVRTRDPADPFAALPLVWFALFRDAAWGPLVEDEPGADGPDATGALAWEPSVDRDRFDDAIARIRRLIRDGETYQVNYTLRLRTSLRGDERRLYRDLRAAQRGSYAVRLALGRYRILSSSPELFFRIDGDRITTRPMKGTAPRGRWPQEDERAASALTESAKDRAENAMIVDLLRNDLGRIAVPGSVRTPALFEAERYETVWQMTSTVTARLPAGTPVPAVMRALFPSGSVTGAPKVRTMQIVRDLEDSPRGVYTGAIGYLAPPGSGEPRANFNVAIRTVALDAETGTAEYGVGGGITYDSTASGEYDEVRAKARVLSVRRPSFSLFETLRHVPGTGFRYEAEHLARLRDSARYFGFAFDEDSVRAALRRAVTGAEGPAHVRCVLERDGRVAATAGPPRTAGPQPVRLAVDAPSVDPADAMRYHKTTDRRPYDEAAGRHPDAGDVLLVNLRAEITESTIANVAVRLGGSWWTPPVDAGLLPGIERAAALAEGRLRERPIRVDDLGEAEEISLLNSVRGWWPAVLAD